MVVLHKKYSSVRQVRKAPVTSTIDTPSPSIKRSYTLHTAWSDSSMDYNLKMLMFGTSNIANPLIAGLSKHWNGQDKRFAKFEDDSQCIITLTTTYQLYNLKQALMQQNIWNAINKSHVIFVHCLGNDIRILARKKHGKALINALTKLVEQYCEIIQNLHNQHKIIIVSNLMPRKDSERNERNRKVMNLRIADRLADLKIPHHSICYDSVIKPQRHLCSDGYHLNNAGVTVMFETISRKLTEINDIISKYNRC